ncbi:hypothetical protein NOM01_10975 [Sporolactobacillus sp. STSJ-5]|uniref:hypothetical protein n=1 Tax=Sporolactobacillus sp. STSJ-5 TaxID=2965076 RepID=UPI00210459FA|nr:hypothetical protein [Sporolactobacillus sp. STSJ-5]MCQ2010538.1 hypothetical protein [Sporolactobacillus sp. STSJ-5]
MPKYLAPIDLAQNELQNATIQNLATTPGNPAPGQIYFDTTQNTLLVFTGTAWKDLAQVLAAADILTMLKTVDGSGSGLDADTLDGHESSYFLTTTGIAASATKLATARKISLGGDAGGYVNFDGTADGTITVVLANSGVTAGTYTKVTVDAKGRVTGSAALSASDIPGLDWTKVTTGKPTTVGGYGITDAIKNLGNVPSFQSGLDASKSSATGSKAVYFATDTKKIYQDTATGTWTQLGGQDTLAWGSITGKPSTFTPPIATDTVLGGIKAGANVTIEADGTLNANDNPAAFIRKQERFVLTAGQTALTLTTGTYKPGTTCMSWFMNGMKQDDRALTETSSTVVTLPSGLPEGTEIMLEYFETINMNPFPYHASEHLSTGADPIPDATDNQDGLMSSSDKTKLDGVATNANNYVHPASHPASMITGLATVATSGSYNDLSSKPTLGTVASKNTGTTNGSIPIIGSDGKLDQTILPALAITDTYPVASQTAMLALTAQVGDIAVRSDINKSFILKTADPTVLANWQELLTPTDLVQSVAGKTGVVVLVKGDVGLGNVDNTSDVNKPVSTAQQTALNAKVDDSQVVTVAAANKILQLDSSGKLPADTTGNSATATKLATSRTISATGGDVVGSAVGFDGTSNISLNLTLSTYRTKKYAATIGDGTTTSFVIAHNLGTLDVAVMIREISTGAGVIPDITITGTNSINVAFATAPTSGQYRVTVVG